MSIPFMDAVMKAIEAKDILIRQLEQRAEEAEQELAEAVDPELYVDTVNALRKAEGRAERYRAALEHAEEFFNSEFGLDGPNVWGRAVRIVVLEALRQSAEVKVRVQLDEHSKETAKQLTAEALRKQVAEDARILDQSAGESDES